MGLEVVRQSRIHNIDDPHPRQVDFRAAMSALLSADAVVSERQEKWPHPASLSADIKQQCGIEQIELPG
ncbi:MAG: hypothetical protein U0992_10745 [Planctomycetaceae bacterium]